MIKIQQPELDVGEVFSTCISRIRNNDLRLRLNFIKPDIINASLLFEQLATSKHFYQFVRKDVVGVNVTTEEMEKVYNGRMAKKKCTWTGNL